VGSAPAPTLWLEVSHGYAASHLWRASPGPGVGSTRVVPFRHTRPPLLGYTTSDLGLGVMGFDRGRFF
jgi:hypothetical protein